MSAGALTTTLPAGLPTTCQQRRLGVPLPLIQVAVEDGARHRPWLARRSHANAQRPREPALCYRGEVHPGSMKRIVLRVQ